LTNHIDSAMSEAVFGGYGEIRAIQKAARSGGGSERPNWPIIILRTPKGWTGPAVVDGHTIEGSFRAHQVPAKDAKSHPVHLKVIENWLRSYNPGELFDANGSPAADILACCPRGTRRMAMNPHLFGGEIRRPLKLPPLSDYGIDLRARGQNHISSVEESWESICATLSV
jgi:xylulose-5-phosphate/fructose-6-phosphate phosphoketolase